MSPTPPRPTNVTTQLAKERNREAAERTMASWIQNCIGIIGFGVGFDSILAALHQAFPDRSPAFDLNLARIIGLTAIAIGILLLVLMIFAYKQEVRSLEREDYLDRTPRLFILGTLVSSITLYGLVAFVAALFVLPWQ
ncbi:YidH family protein [Myxosarcina sp. GI1(2024)]